MLFMKWSFILLIFVPSCLFAKGYNEDYDYSGGFKFSANMNFYQLEPTIGWRINKSFHINCGLRFQTILRAYPSVHSLNYSWEIENEDNDNRSINFFVAPSLQYKLCIVEQKKEKYTRYFNLFLEPGLLIQPFVFDHFYVVHNNPNNRYKQIDKRRIDNFKWAYLFFNSQIGLEYLINDGSFFIGYELNNQDFYIKRRNIVVEGEELNQFFPKKEMCQSIFIGLRVYM